MELLIVRHAEAESPASTADADDAARRLTEQGRQRWHRAVDGLVTILPDIDAIATSPLVRAAQTARILAGPYKIRKPDKLTALAPAGDRESTLAWLLEQGENDTVAVVGHEPHLGLLASWLLAAPLNHFVEFKKGGACLLAWPDSPAAGTAWLRWALTPGQLRKLGKT